MRAIRRVSQTGRLIVRPTSAVRRYLNEDTDALAAAKQLGVDSVLAFALAHADLAYAYATLAVFLDPTQPARVEDAKEEINRAQELDPQLAETHLARFQAAIQRV